jgi:hypothetical protein
VDDSGLRDATTSPAKLVRVPLLSSGCRWSGC